MGATAELRALVLRDNVTGKGSAASRQKVWGQLRARYVLDPSVEEYRAFLDALQCVSSPREEALLCFLMLARMDRLDHDPKQYDFTVQAVNLNQAREGAETAIAFFISMVSALLERPTDPTTVVTGEMSVKGMLQKVASLPERLELARDAGAKKILVPSENKRDLADVPDEVLTRLQPVFYTDPINAAIRAVGLD